MMKRQFLVLSFCIVFSTIMAQTKGTFTFSHGAIVRGDSGEKEIALVFTGDEFGDGLPAIVRTLQKKKIKASFFFTGRFYRNPAFRPYVMQLYEDGNYLSLHSNDHLLYCDWNKRDSLLVSEDSFTTDLQKNVDALKDLRIAIPSRKYFIPPYEWWNDSIARWSRAKGWQLINYTPGITTAGDYTYPAMASYKNSENLIASLKQFEASNPGGLNGAIVLIHAGTDPRRKDKLYDRLEEVISYLTEKGYGLKRVDELLAAK